MTGSVLLAILIGLAAVCALAMFVGAVSAVVRVVRDRLGWTRVVREVVHTDTRMLGDAFRLSLAHFQAVNELRKLGGRR
jgi:hypothetical protein